MTTPTRETRTAGTSEAVTRDIRVSVEAQYSPAHSHPANQQWFFLYTIRISNEGQETVQLISRQVLPPIPAARLINGLQSPADNSHIDHALLSGYRLALIGSMLLPKGAYAWDGQSLRHGGRSIAPPQLAHVVRAMQDIFPELNVTGWTVIHSPDGNLHEPVIDRHKRSAGAGETVQVVNAAGLVRGLKQFLSSGPAPNTVNVQILARLLRGMH